MPDLSEVEMYFLGLAAVATALVALYNAPSMTARLALLKRYYPVVRAYYPIIREKVVALIARLRRNKTQDR